MLDYDSSVKRRSPMQECGMECGIRRNGGILFRLIPHSISSTERESYTTPQRGGMGGGMGVVWGVVWGIVGFPGK